jgi:UDP-glucuronate 4-epimerase
MKILITGTAGFIGYHLVKRFAGEGHIIVGLDGINDYYDVNLKYGRLKETGIDREKIEYNKLLRSEKQKNYSFIKLNLEDIENIGKLFEREKFDIVCNLAAQAGVRYSIENPYAYIDSNINGFLNVLEGCRHNKVKNLVYASSSSVYGLNKKMPFSTENNVDHPVSLYAATKKSNELMAHAYSNLYDLPTTGLRFFTVYGPWGRPDMAYFKFTKSILNDKPIDVYNYGEMKRDFTYIDDIVDGVYKTLFSTPEKNPNWDAEKPNPAKSKAPFRVYNIGNNKPENLMDFISVLEKNIGKKAKINMMPMQPGDVKATWADTEALERDIGYKPDTPIEVGIKNFVDWYLKYYE